MPTSRRPQKRCSSSPGLARPHPLVAPGDPPRRRPARPAAHPACPHHRLVMLATRPPSQCTTFASEATNATVMLRNPDAVEADETFIGRKEGAETPKGGYSHENAVLALVERGGKVRCVHIDSVTSEEVGRHVRENVAREAWLMTDEGRHYRQAGTEFA